MIFKYKTIEEFKKNLQITEEDIIEAVQYGMWYSANCQKDEGYDNKVPTGNILQWFYNRKGLYELTEEGKILMGESK
jgi:hypothetical protein